MNEAKHTIYINNLNEKVKLEELKKALKAVFAQFGDILEIIAGKSMRMHGQAFVSFKEKSSASVAIRSMQGFPLYDKPMRIQYAKKESDCIAKLNGTYVEKPKIVKPEIKKKTKKKSLTTASAPMPSMPPNLNQLQHGFLPGVTPGSMVKNLVPSVFAPPFPVAAPPIMKIEPNHILFLSNLPQEANQMMLNVLFGGFQGFKEVRLVPGKPDIAFVEFENEKVASFAKDSLHGFKLTPTHPITITFANK